MNREKPLQEVRVLSSREQQMSIREVRDEITEGNMEYSMPVEVYTISGRKKATYQSAQEAAEALGVHVETIRRACRGDAAICKVYELRYGGEKGAELYKLRREKARAEKRETYRRLREYISKNQFGYTRKLACSGLTAKEVFEMSQCAKVNDDKWRILRRQLDKISLHMS